MFNCSDCSRYRVSHDPFRQLLLGSSQDGFLTILSPSISLLIEGENDAPSNAQFITRLPDELFNEIFCRLIPNYDSNRRSTPNFYKTALPLLGVSKRFYHLAIPHMYRTIQLSLHGLTQPCWAIKKFRRAIKENRALGTMVRTLSVNVNHRTPDTVSKFEFNTANEILNLCSNVESFDLRGCYEHPLTWPMIKTAVANWPQIKHVGLHRVDMPPICELIVATPNLRTLHLHGLDVNRRSSNPHSLWTPPAKDNERKSNITTLIIDDFAELPEALQNLLKLPRILEHFAFAKSGSVRWNLRIFQSLLSPHQQTLKIIEIGWVGREAWPINFLDFPCLEQLKMSYWTYKESPEVAATTLLAPRLHTFIWNFVSKEDYEPWDAFGVSQKEWLLKFAEIAAARKSALRKIEIVFRPDKSAEPMTREQLTALVSSPWDLMADARAKIKLLGIDLEWNEFWSREECLRRIEFAKEFAEEFDQNFEEESLEHGQENVFSPV